MSDESRNDDSGCGACDEHDCACHDAVEAPRETFGDQIRALVILLAGFGAASTPLYILHLSYQDAVRMQVAWKLDDRILGAALAALAAITYCAWKSKK